MTKKDAPNIDNSLELIAERLGILCNVFGMNSPRVDTDLQDISDHLESTQEWVAGIDNNVRTLARSAERQAVALELIADRLEKLQDAFEHHWNLE